MQGLIVFPDSPTLYPASCEVASGKWLPLIYPEETKEIIISCNNPFRQNIVTCKDQFKEEFIKEVNGLDLNSKLLSSIEDLPTYIPILDVGSRNISNIPKEFPVVGMTLHDIITQSVIDKAGRYHEPDTIAFRAKILQSDSFKSKKVILFLTGSDTLIEWVWYNRGECRLFETIKQMGFWAVSGFNFSVIGGECPFSQALNQKRSLFSASLIENAELLAIPHVYAITPFHIDRWIKWFLQNPGIRLFTINCQLQKSEQDIAQIITTVKSILRAVSSLHVLLQGFRIDKIEQFGVFLERIHFSDKAAVKDAQSRTQIIYDETTVKLIDKQVRNVKINDLATTNMKARNIFIEEKKSKMLQRVFDRLSKTTVKATPVKK